MPRSAGARPILRLEDHRAGAVAEKDAGPPVGPVHDPAEGLGADHDHAVAWPDRISALALASA
jgi:hypothetical protein